MHRSIRVIGPMLATLLAAAVLLVPSASASPSAAKKPTGEITVSAASSLTDAFTELGTKFERKYKGTTVTFNFDSSSNLALQIQSGAPVDVFASADEANVDKLVQGGQVTADPVVFARNKLRIATKPDNPANIEALADLATAGVVALCDSTVPCGKYAEAALAAAGVTIPPDKITRGLNAKATLTAVSAGDADAAIVYVTDVKAAGSSVEGVKIPDGQNQIAVYPIVPLTDASNPATAKAFAKFIASKAGRKVLKRYGFLAP